MVKRCQPINTWRQFQYKCLRSLSKIHLLEWQCYTFCSWTFYSTKNSFNSNIPVTCSSNHGSQDLCFHMNWKAHKYLYCKSDRLNKKCVSKQLCTDFKKDMTRPRTIWLTTLERQHLYSTTVPLKHKKSCSCMAQ